MRKLTPKGIIGLSTTAFLFLILMSIIYFNNQVQFNAVEAKWELQNQYIITEGSITQIEQDIIDYYLTFDGINDYVYINNNMSGNLGLFEIEFRPSVDIVPGSGDDTILLSNDSNRDYEIAIAATAGDLTGENVFIRTDFTSSFWEFGTFNANQIYNLKIIYENGNWNAYVDDLQLNRLSGSNSVIPLNVYDYIGTRYNNTLSYQGDIFYLKLADTNNNIALEYLFDESSGITLNDNVGNNDANIVGATWNNYVSGTEIVSITNPAIDSYQVFENIRNNATTVNPLGFMNTLVSIPAQAVGYYDSFTDFVTGGLGLPITRDFYANAIEQGRWWTRIPIFIDKFNNPEIYGSPWGD